MFNSIVPVLINESTIQLGTAIPFMNQGYADMVNCHLGDKVTLFSKIEDNSISIYPNPTSDIVIIKSALEDYEVLLFAPNGQLLESSRNINQINIQHLPQGIYFLSVKTEKEIVNHKIIKQ